MRVLLTGGAGFIGHHVLEHILKTTDWDVVSLDRLDTSGNLNRIADVLRGLPTSVRSVHEDGRARVIIVHHDLKAELNANVRKRVGPVDVILHLAAGSHVDRSIADPVAFVYDNVVGTANILEFARQLGEERHLKAFVYFSTDEVFGPAPEGVQFGEWDRYKSGNPYAATKAGGEELVLAYWNTFGLPAIITHTMNVFGERQDPEKFIPICVRKILAHEEILVHADKTLTRAGSRFWIHARNVASAICFLLDGSTELGDKYNIVGEREVDNAEMVARVGEVLGVTPRYRLVDFHSSRPGHDLRYALDGRKMRDLGWTLPIDFRESLERTVRWMVQHEEWLA